MNKKTILIFIGIVVLGGLGGYYYVQPSRPTPAPTPQQLPPMIQPTPTVQTGEIYSTPVNCSDQNDGNLQAFQSELTPLDRAHPESILKAIHAYEKHCLDQIPNPFNDEAYLIFRAFYSEVLRNVPAQALLNPQPETEEKTATNEGKPDWINHLGDFGISTANGEGDIYLTEAPDFQRSVFSGSISESLREFLIQTAAELKQGFADDAALIITWDQFAARLIFWDQWLKRHPDSPIRKEANYVFQNYLGLLLTGMDNSRIYDYDTEVLLPEIKTLYQRIMKENPDTTTASAIQKFYGLLETNAFKKPDGMVVRRFLEKEVYSK